LVPIATTIASLSAELAPHGVHAVCLRTTGIPETETIDVVFELHARAVSIARQQFLSMIEGMTDRRRSTSAELANATVFIASDRASAMTGTVANLTGAPWSTEASSTRAPATYGAKVNVCLAAETHAADVSSGS